MKANTLDKLIYYYKHLALFLSLLVLATPQYTVFGKIGFVIVGLGSVLCIADLFINQNFLKAKRMIWLLLFLASFVITILLNRHSFFNLNIMSFGYAAIALIIMYPQGNKTNEEIVKEMFAINNTVLIFTAVLSTIGFGMFVVLFRFIHNYGPGQDYIVGWSSSNRLFGLYSNTGLMITSIAFALTVIQFEVAKNIYQNGISKKYKVFLIYSLVINFIHLVLENASGAYISLAVFIGIYVFTKLSQKYKDENAFKCYIKSLAIAAGSIIVLFVAIYVFRYILNFIPRIYDFIENLILNNGAGNDKLIKDFTMERDIPEGYGALTGRPKIWARGIEEFLKKPIFGWGPLSFGNIQVLEAPLRHWHNIIIQSLAGNGIVGTTFLFFFLISSALEIIRKLWSKKLRANKYYSVIFASAALLFMLAVNSMAEVTIMYMTRFSVLLFWLYLGYVIKLIYDGKNSRFDKPLLFVYNKLHKNKEK